MAKPVITSGVSRKTGAVWYAIRELKPSLTFISKEVYDSLAAAGAEIIPPRNTNNRTMQH